VLACLDADSETLWQSPRITKEQGYYDPWNYLVSGRRFIVQRKKETEAWEVADAAGSQGPTCKKLWSCEARPGGTALILAGRLIVIAPGGDSRRLAARDAATGKLLWDKRVEKARLSGGIGVDGKLILTSGKEVILAAVADEGLKVLSRAAIADFESCGRTPAYSNGHLFVRDVTGLVKCLDLKTPADK